MIRRSKRIADIELRKIQEQTVEIYNNNNYALKIDNLCKTIYSKIQLYIVKIKYARNSLTIFNYLLRLSKTFLENHTIIQISNKYKSSYYRFIDIVYSKYQELLYDIQFNIWNNVPLYIKKRVSEHMIQVMAVCQKEKWNIQKYLFKLPLPNDIIRHIFINWL